MYAIIVDGGRQYKVTEGQELVIDYRDASSGDAVNSIRSWLTATARAALGGPTLGGASDGQSHGRHAGAQADRAEVSPPQNLSPQHRPSPTVHQGTDRKDRGVSNGSSGFCACSLFESQSTLMARLLD